MFYFIDQGYSELLELFDLDKDPTEENNLAASEKLATSSKLGDKVEELKAFARSLVTQMVRLMQILHWIEP